MSEKADLKLANFFTDVKHTDDYESLHGQICSL